MKVKNYKCVVFLLIFSLFAGMWNGSVVKGTETVSEAASDGTGGKVIKEITIAGVTPPETIDEKPSTEGIEVEKVVVESASVETAKVETAEVETAVVETKNVEWKSDAGNSVYTLSITLEAKDGYRFGDKDSLKVVVKGKQDTVINCPANIDIKDSKTATITWEFKDEGATSSPIPPTATPTESPAGDPTDPTETPTISTPPSTPQEIENIKIDNIAVPEGGKILPTVSPRIDTPGIEIKTIEWVEWQEENSQIVPIGSDVIYGATYELHLSLKAVEGYTFAQSVAVRVTDNSGKIYELNVEKDKNDEIIAIITFEIKPKEIEEVTISNITMPEINKTLPTVIPMIGTPGIDTPGIEIEWRYEDGNTVDAKKTVEYDTTYKLCLTLKSKWGYKFAEELDVIATDDSGKVYEPNVAKGENGEIIVTITFDEYKSIEIKELTISNITAPKGGESTFPPISPTIDPQGIEVSAVKWQDKDDQEVEGEVDYGAAYKLCLTLKAQQGYKFPEYVKNDLTVNIEGKVKEDVEVDYEKEEKGEGNVIVKVKYTTEQKPSPQPPTPSPELPQPPTEITIIDKVIISGIALPDGGELSFPPISPTIAPQGIKTLTAKWQDKDGQEVRGKVDYETDYKLCLELEAEAGYIFSEYVTGTVETNKGTFNLNFEKQKNENGEITRITVTIKFTTDPSPQLPTPTPGGEPSQPPVATPSGKPSQSQVPMPTLQPTATPGTYTITLNANGGTLSQKKITFTVDQMSKVKLPTPKKKGFLFIGWYQGKTRVSQITKANNISLKAQWVKSTIDLTYQSTIKCISKLKLSSDVKLEKIKIEKKYKKYITVNQKKKTMKGTKYVKKAVATVTIDGEEFEVTVKMKLPQPKVVATPEKRMKYYVTGAYREFRFSYKNAVKGATKVVAEYKPSNAKSFKKCGSIQNRFKGAYALVKKGNSVWFRVTIYYGRYASPKSKKILLKG